MYDIITPKQATLIATQIDDALEEAIDSGKPDTYAITLLQMDGYEKAAAQLEWALNEAIDIGIKYDGDDILVSETDSEKLEGTGTCTGIGKENVYKTAVASVCL